MLLDLHSGPVRLRPPSKLASIRRAPAGFAFEEPSESPLRLVDITSPIVNSRTAPKKTGRKSAAIGGRAYVLHPEPATRAQFDSILRSLGLLAIEFDDEGRLAESISQESPEIILWGIPGCTAEGLDRISRVTRDAPRKSLPIVVVASLGDEITPDEVYDAGACDILLLPLPCHRLAPALSVALLKNEILSVLMEEHGDGENYRAARNLIWRAAKVWGKRRGHGDADALRHVLTRSSSRGHTLTRTAMEMVAEGLFP
jgi:Response regulator with putative antiterminator output domain